MKLSIQNLCVRIFQFARAFALAIVIVSTSTTVSPAFAEEYTEDPCEEAYYNLRYDSDWKITNQVTYRLCRLFVAGDTCRWALRRGYDRGGEATIYRLCLPLAEQGDAYMQGTIGAIYLHGNVVPSDPVEAVRWFRKAAEQGDESGQKLLGESYYLGRGVPKDWTKAVHWYRKALYEHSLILDGNNKIPIFPYSACFHLSSIYRNGGFGVPKDYLQAHKYISLAALGHSFSADERDLLTSLEKLMTKQQIAEGKRWAAEFVKAIHKAIQ